MKIRVTKPTPTTDDGKKPTVASNQFAAWGSAAPVAQSQGWFPETTHNGVTIYRSNYSPAFNALINPVTKQKNHIAVIGNPNQSMDIVIRDNDGNIVQTIAKAQSPNAVQTYLSSVVGTRQNAIARTTTPIDIATK